MYFAVKRSGISKIRCGYIGYRDFEAKTIGLTIDHFDIIQFTEDIESVKSFILKSEAKSCYGRDTPEDVLGALD